MRKRKRNVIGFTGLLTSSAFGPSCIEDKKWKKVIQKPSMPAAGNEQSII